MHNTAAPEALTTAEAQAAANNTAEPLRQA